MLSDVCDFGVQLGDTGFRLAPILGELFPARHAPLPLRQFGQELFQWLALLFRGQASNVTVSESGGKWYVSVQTEREVETPKHPSTSGVGMDWGVVNFVTLSDGEVVGFDASVLVVYLEALGDAKTFPLAFLLELGEVGCFPKEVGVGTFEILNDCCKACAGTADRNWCCIFQLGSNAHRPA